MAASGSPNALLSIGSLNPSKTKLYISEVLTGSATLYRANLNSNGLVTTFQSTGIGWEPNWAKNNVIISSDSNVELIESFQLSPNPVSEVLNISIPNGSTQVNRMVLLNTAGQQIDQAVVQSPSTSIEVGHLAAGVYLIQIETPDGICTKKFIKQ